MFVSAPVSVQNSASTTALMSAVRRGEASTLPVTRFSAGALLFPLLYFLSRYIDLLHFCCDRVISGSMHAIAHPAACTRTTVRSQLSIPRHWLLILLTWSLLPLYSYFALPASLAFYVVRLLPHLWNSSSAGIRSQRVVLLLPCRSVDQMVVERDLAVPHVPVRLFRHPFDLRTL